MEGMQGVGRCRVWTCDLARSASAVSLTVRGVALSAEDEGRS